ncbi:MAG: hypothetical protein GY853_01035 [PVC group bacterium]|nr:hypothetical protein [PVC group bacterium]
MPTIKEMVIAQFSINEDISLKDCQKVVKKLTKPNFYKIKKQYKEQGRQSIQKPRGSTQRGKANSIPPDTPSHPHTIKYDGDDLKFTHNAYVKAIEEGKYNLLTSWVQFLDKTGKLSDYKTNKEEELEETFKYMTPRELVMEAIGHQNVVDVKERKQLRNTLQPQDSQTL